MTEHVADEVVRALEAVERVLAGESIWSICTHWNADGVPTVMGGPWTVQTLSSILTSGRIAGLRAHKGIVVAKGRWEPIITEAKRDDLVAALAPKRSRPRRGRTYPLTGLMRCGMCGAPLRSLAREGGRRSYACRKGPGPDGCGSIRIQALGIERYVRDLICGMLADPVTRAVMASLGEPANNGHAALARQLRAVESKLQRLVDLYTEGDIDRATFRARRDDIEEEAGTIRATLANRTGRPVLADVPGTFEDLVSAWDERGIDFQRRLIETLMHPIVVNPAGAVRRTFDPGRVEITLRA